MIKGGMITTQYEVWAEQEFGKAELGDERRRKRLVEIAAQMARAPAGRVTALYTKLAEREATYRLLENPAVDNDEIGRAAHFATAKRCSDQEYVIVPVDQTSLNLRDEAGRRGLGVIGGAVGARGLHVMTAIAVASNGTPMGISGQSFWARKPSGIERGKYDARPVKRKETQHWLTVIKQTRESFAAKALNTKPWFQLDRGGDAWPILAGAVDHRDWLTVRATHNRQVVTDDGKTTSLWNHLRRKEPQGSFRLEVQDTERQLARSACMQVQFSRVTISVLDRRTNWRRELAVWAVRAVEIETTPHGSERIEWMLITTRPVESIADAVLVLNAYAMRWRIEEFHKTWKTGGCRIEDTQLQARDHIVRFAIISASVAMRIQRLTHLARTAPGELATIEFSRAEIEATILLREPKGVERQATPTVGEVIRWIADIGGFMGPSPKNKDAARRPGPTVIRRGLEKIEPVASILARGVKL